MGHPLWLASLALLVVNDHLLKRAGLLPGWLTGKLSDIAGLIVAPVLLATILRARRPGARAAACASVAVTFVAIKLYSRRRTPSSARSRSRAFPGGSGPIRRILLALLVLPAAWWLTGRRAPATPAGPAPSRVRERLLVIAGACACMATSLPVDPYQTFDLSLVNRTSGIRAVALYKADPAALDCAAIEAGDLTSLTGATFSSPTCTELAPGKALASG